MSTSNEIAEDLNEIRCVVRPLNQPFEQYPFIDTEEVAQKFTSEVVDFLRLQGVNVVNAYTPPQFGAAGGGFMYELLELLKSFRIISVIVKLIKGVFFVAEKVTDGRYKKGNIYIHINLSISSVARATENNYHDDISRRLECLLRMAKTSAEMLQEKYPIYSFGINAHISLSGNEFSATFSHNLVDGEYRYKKISNIASRVRLTEAMHLDIAAARFGFFRHTVHRPTLIIGSPHRAIDYRWIDDGKKYYTLLSDEIINEFKHKKKTMPYAKYYKKYLK